MIQSTLAFFPLLLTPSAVVPAHVQSPRTELPQSIQAQLPTGSWPGDRAVGPVGVTSLQLLSLIADGHGMTRGKWKDTVQKGAGWLLSQQDPTTGCIGCSDPSALKIERALLDHAWATYALSELAYFEKDSPWEAGEAASGLAARALLDAQQGRGGFGTARATGWAAFALVAARDSGQPIDVARIMAALDALQRNVHELRRTARATGDGKETETRTLEDDRPPHY